MQKSIIIANWKANKTVSEAKEWLQALSSSHPQIHDEKTVIVCPPAVLLPEIAEYRENQKLNISLGAQDVSQFHRGAYTGELPAELLKAFVRYIILGHSERRLLLHEADQAIAKKCQQVIAQSLTPILCVQGIQTPIPEGVLMVAYEPVEAIGTGNPDDPENVNMLAKALKEKGAATVLYGGSVTAENVKLFTSLPDIDGVLVGKASLDPAEFSGIIQNA